MEGRVPSGLDLSKAEVRAAYFATRSRAHIGNPVWHEVAVHLVADADVCAVGKYVEELAKGDLAQMRQKKIAKDQYADAYGKTTYRIVRRAALPARKLSNDRRAGPLRSPQAIKGVRASCVGRGFML